MSKQFAIKMGGWGGGALVALLLGNWVVNAQITTHQLATSKAVWADMQPRYERVSAMQTVLASKRELQKELQGWASSRINWNEQLANLQDVVPAEVQLMKLVVSSEFLALKEPGAKQDEVTPARQFRVRLDGRTSGDRADEVVVQFVNRLQQGEDFKDSLKEVKLQGLNSQGHAKDDTARLFGVEGLSPARSMP